jgi:hypothetical protein
MPETARAAEASASPRGRSDEWPVRHVSCFNCFDASGYWRFIGWNFRTETVETRNTADLEIGIVRHRDTDRGNVQLTRVYRHQEILFIIIRTALLTKVATSSADSGSHRFVQLSQV